jgi:nucleotidyltransferase/DNA polymerase involved in DNA repair
MLKFGIHCFTVIYIPFYFLQCAQQKRLLRGANSNLSPQQEQLSLDISNSCLDGGFPQQVDEKTFTNIPAALLDHDGIHVIELNPAAERAGIRPGASTSQAFARSPELVLYTRAPSHEQHIQDTLVQLAYNYSPYIENSAPGICTIDVTKTRNRQIGLRKLLAQLRALGLKAQAGTGPNPEIALQAAKIADPLLEISQDCNLLQSLPLEFLDPSPFLLTILKSWGVRTLGALAHLPRVEIGHRLGLEGLSLWDRAAGRSTKVLQFVQPSETFEESMDFEQPLETLEPVLFILRRFLERLSLRTESVYLLIAELRLTLGLENGEKIVRSLQIPAPTRDVGSLYGIAVQYLETLQTAAPITSFHLKIKPSKPHGRQFDLFQGKLRDPNRFFQTLARLAALVGAEQVGTPQKINTHQPDSFRMQMPDFDCSVKNNNRPKIGPGLRRYRPGILASVELNNDKPALLKSSLISGKIVQVQGPWNLSGNWWDRTRWEISEWDVVLENGGIYRLAESLGQWEIVGVYD